MSRGFCRRGVLLAISLVLVLLECSGIASAQPLNPTQFGRQKRADAASDAVTLAVQQAISDLPPTSGDAFVYEVVPGKEQPVRSQLLSPPSFRVPQNVPAGSFRIRVSTSYFSLSETLGPI